MHAHKSCGTTKTSFTNRETFPRTVFISTYSCQTWVLVFQYLFFNSWLRVQCWQLTGNNPPSRENYYEVMVFIHGEDFAAGDAMMYAGHVLAKKEVVVITLNYRLGALGKTWRDYTFRWRLRQLNFSGFMSTMDEHSPGNYGLMDIIQALKWIQTYIERFHGKKEEVSLISRNE